MKRRLLDSLYEGGTHNVHDGWDPNELFHPAQAFDHPSHVVNDPDLTLNEKRAILASWASDACAPEAAPHLRCAPHGKQPVLFDDVMDALRALDKQANGKDAAHYPRVLRGGRLEHRSRPPSPNGTQSTECRNLLRKLFEGGTCSRIVSMCPGLWP